MREASFVGHGCAISTASASLMTEAVKGKPVAEVEALFRDVHALLTEGREAADPARDFGKLEVLSGVKEFPARVKCATLAWHTLHNALVGEHETAHTRKHRSTAPPSRRKPPWATATAKPIPACCNAIAGSERTLGPAGDAGRGGLRPHHPAPGRLDHGDERRQPVPHRRAQRRRARPRAAARRRTAGASRRRTDRREHRARGLGTASAPATTPRMSRSTSSISA